MFYNVKLKLLESCVRISSGQLKCLKFFHRFLFVDVIKVVGNYMEYSPENAAMSFLIVPLKGITTDALMAIN